MRILRLIMSKLSSWSNTESLFLIYQEKMWQQERRTNNQKAIWSVCLFICYFFLISLLILYHSYKFFTVNFINSDLFIIFLIHFKSFPIVFNQLFLPGSGKIFVSVFCSPLFCFLYLK